LNQIVDFNPEAKTLTVGAGIRYGELCTYLHERGFALHNLASLPHISVGGAIATATHGSGVTNGNLATSVSALEFIDAKGEVVQLSREMNADFFNGAVVHLGLLGIITKVTLDLVPTFRMRQDVFLNLPMKQLADHFDEIMSFGYSVSLFTDWQTENINQVWIKRVTDGGLEKELKEFYGATPADRNVHPILEISAENCTEQMGVAGPWYERLPHFKMGFTPSSGEELQAEFFISRQFAVQAIHAVHTLRNEIKPYLLITEIRTIAADDLWMSPCYQQDSVAIHFTLKQDIDGVNGLLPKIEEKLKPFGVRPHWGKLYILNPFYVHYQYHKMNDFQKLVRRFDPKGKFQNDFTMGRLADGIVY
jgi:xylitol oxidase